LPQLDDGTESKQAGHARMEQPAVATTAWSRSRSAFVLSKGQLETTLASLEGEPQHRAKDQIYLTFWSLRNQKFLQTSMKNLSLQ
jgi:hypothetical protein